MSKIDINDAAHPVRIAAVDILEALCRICDNENMFDGGCWLPAEDMIVERILNLEKSKKIAKKERKTKKKKVSSLSRRSKHRSS
jgi:hypothetical protein